MHLKFMEYILKKLFHFFLQHRCFMPEISRGGDEAENYIL